MRKLLLQGLKPLIQRPTALTPVIWVLPEAETEAKV